VGLHRKAECRHASPRIIVHVGMYGMHCDRRSKKAIWRFACLVIGNSKGSHHRVCDFLPSMISQQDTYQGRGRKVRRMVEKERGRLWRGSCRRRSLKLQERNMVILVCAWASRSSFWSRFDSRRSIIALRCKSMFIHKTFCTTFRTAHCGT
jgi:hypothetical protein